MSQNFCLPEGYTYELAEDGFSLTAPLPCPAEEARCLAVAAASWVREAAGGIGKIHWPNHVVAEEKRICAVRCRAGADGTVTFTFRPDVSALPVPPEGFAAGVCRAAAEALEGYPENRPALITRYCEECATVMQYVRTTYRGVPIFGFAFGVDRHGGLMVMTQESRTVVTIYGGEAEITDKDGGLDMPPELPHVPGC